jgi:hypothetical protein
MLSMTRRYTKRSGGPESLLRIPLVRQMLSDPSVKLCQRAVDSRWVYERPEPWQSMGFNPFYGAVFYGKHSQFSAWLGEPESSARNFNENDFLVREVFLAVHDYLHCWAVNAIQSLKPELGFGTKRISRKNFEDFVFCFLLTEAAATVGLDYWYLGVTDINDVCPIGTALTTLTSYYTEKDEAEFRRFARGFTAQDKKFLGWLTRLYCGHPLEEFSAWDRYHSPKLRRWLDKEVDYGRLQREYARRWLTFLSGDEPFMQDATAPLVVEKPWMQALVGDLSELLWEKVRKGKPQFFKSAPDPEEVWQSSPKKTPDFSWMNLNRSRLEQVRKYCGASDRVPSELEPLARQLVWTLDYSRADREKVLSFSSKDLTQDFEKTMAFFKTQPRVSRVGWEPRDLFLLG